MKAVVQTRYGPPEVLQLREVEKPVPRDNQVLIKIHATSVSTGDVVDRSGHVSPWAWLPTRLVLGFRKPRRSIPGADLAGEIESIGKDVKRFRKGDRVFGSTGWGSGAYAQYKCVPENGPLALMPANVSYEEAAVVSFGAVTALFFVKKAGIQAGQRILINGASGGVGQFAIQLAKYYGAEVTGVCSAAKVELVRSLGADSVIDYREEDFTQSGQTYDAVFDATGKSSFSRCKGSLKKGGSFLTTAPSPAAMLQMLWTSMFGSYKVISGIPNPRPEDMDFLKERMDAGEVRSIIDRRYPLEQIAEAHRYAETGQQQGYIAITVGHEDQP